MENPASVQAMLADICVGNCGQLNETQRIPTKVSTYRQILKQFVKYTVYLDRKLGIGKDIFDAISKCVRS